MDWFSIGIAAGCGAIAGMVSALVAKKVQKEKSRQVASAVAFALIFGGLYGLAKITIIADHKVELEKAAFEEAIVGNPAMEAIRQYAPEKMDEIHAYLETAVRESHTTLEAENNARQILAQLIVERLPKASDEALLNAIDLVVEQLEVLYARGDDTCFRFLHPQVSGGIAAQQVFTAELMQKDYESTGMILSSYDSNRPVPTDAEAGPIVNPIFGDLAARHGQAAMAQLGNVAAPDVDRRQVCEISIDVYESILALPRDDAATALRWMMN